MIDETMTPATDFATYIRGVKSQLRNAQLNSKTTKLREQSLIRSSKLVLPFFVKLGIVLLTNTFNYMLSFN